ncbi:PTS mannitol transporter subunit IICBA [Buchnera aphidicola (Thelaxes californica)]|uniref:PTS mannitol transporter subunit IICBA n=1 Tax=Buchnera aphidicola (Thelaxes californica) TaxID=1315998 RepID=A0A4D6YD41_9GAMM|nr:PTS mannitol transporter subunit IICBA [Buchnera aphidicola]QCI26962.1 PTS mannitol transporter subunit IICBA [Buchnera aphidicola (Thelaxes californica)]
MLKKIVYFLSSIIMPNMTVFIIYGFLHSFFSTLGWFPNENIEKISNFIILYLIPILLAYTGGASIAKHKGGVIASIVVLGVVLFSFSNMFLPAILIGPLVGWLIKKNDIYFKNNVKSGFEMIIISFSNSIITILLLFVSLYIITPLFEYVSYMIFFVTQTIIDFHYFPLISIFVEPSKVYFLNNFINYTFCIPLGMQEIHDSNRSIFFLIESNPGPGAGILFAFSVLGKNRNVKKFALNGALIHLFGGVHEIYFPYVLKNLKLFVPLICGGIAGTFLLVTFKGGIYSIVSPGSILSILAMTPPGSYVVNILVMFISFLVSFFISLFLIYIDNLTLNKYNKKKYATNVIKSTLYDSEELKNNHLDFNVKKKSTVQNNIIKQVIVACDAGLGSSALASNIFSRELKKMNVANILVSNSAINLLPNDPNILVITHKFLTERAKKKAPSSLHYSITNFLDVEMYKKIINEVFVYQKNNIQTTISENKNNIKLQTEKMFILSKENIFLNCTMKNKETVIQFVGEHLYKLGYVQKEYIDSMLEREKLSTTYLGECIAIPHGTLEGKKFVKKTGIVFVQIPEGVMFGDHKDDIAKLVIGIAANNNEHLHVVSKITNALDDPIILNNLMTTNDKKKIIKVFL